MGIPAWLWFAIAVLAVGGGVWLLLGAPLPQRAEREAPRRRSRRSAKSRERSRWAALRGWQYVDVDQVLPTRWERGVLARYSGIVGTDVVAGATFTSAGRRPVYVLDLDVNGRTVAVVAAVRCRRPVPTTVELWLPDVPAPKDERLDLLGPVGARYAFVADNAIARPLITSDLVEATEQFGEDVTVAWFERDWVLAAVEPGADPEQIEQVLRALGDLADVVDPFEVDPNGHEDHAEAQDEPFDFEAEEAADAEHLDAGAEDSQTTTSATVVSLSAARRASGRADSDDRDSGDRDSGDREDDHTGSEVSAPGDRDAEDSGSTVDQNGSAKPGTGKARRLGKGSATVDLGTPDDDVSASDPESGVKNASEQRG